MTDYPRPRRVNTLLKKLRVIALITVWSAAAGSVAAVVTLLLKAAVVLEGDYARLNIAALGVASLLLAGIGAGTGAVLGPAAAFLLLRHVPLGRALGWTATGTALGAVVGFYAGLRDPSLIAVGVGALIGFVVSVFGLSRTHARRGARPSRG